MGRTYAAILGPVAFGAVVARGLISGDVDGTLCAAPWALFIFAAIGYVIGWIAERTITEAVEARFHAQLQAEETADTAAKTATHLTGDRVPQA
jgi:hypothetical protein